jgi:hypothetical protein
LIGYIFADSIFIIVDGLVLFFKVRNILRAKKAKIGEQDYFNTYRLPKLKNYTKTLFYFD